MTIEPASNGARTEEAPRPGRAGRNLPVAIAVGVGLGVVIGLALFTVEVAFLAVVTVAILLGLRELSGVLATRGARVPVLPVGVGAVGMIAGSYVGGAPVLVVALALTVLATVVWRLFGGQRGFVRDITAGVFCAVYGPFLAGFVALMLSRPDGTWRVFTFVVVVVASDVGGYAVGATLGRHAMAPTVSPRKSWEGLAGSVAASVAVGIAAVTLALRGPWWAGAVVGAVAAITATLGDLVESLVKRDLGIKDMGRLLPGHGGVMDRLDSLLASVAVSWLLLETLVPVAG